MGSISTVSDMPVDRGAYFDPRSERLPNGRLKSEYYAPISPDRFAPKEGDQILEIGIIGAGIAGLTAAIALAHAGHNVDIYERSRFAYEIGAAISLAPNAARVLSHYDFNFHRARPTPVDGIRFMDGATLDLGGFRSTPNSDLVRLYGYDWTLYHRADLHNELKRAATEPRKHSSNVAKINLLSEVTDVSLQGSITLANGQEIKKDVVIIADGVRTKLAPKVVGIDEDIASVPSGTMCYRFLVPTEKLLKDPRTNPLFDVKRHDINIAPVQARRLVWYPCRDDELQNLGYFVPDTISENEEEVFNIPTSLGELVEAGRILDPTLQAVIEKAEDLKLWRLCSRTRPLKKLTRGNLVMVGDTAHPMLPHQGQGAGMAVEDGGTLGVLLSGIKSKAEIPERLQLFEQLRVNRVTAMVIFSSVGQDEADKIEEAVRPYVDGPLPKTPEEYRHYNFSANVLRDAMELLERHQRS